MTLRLLSNLFSLFYLYQSLQLVYQIGRQWRPFIAEPMTAVKKQLSERASFFISVPISVFIHELGHAIFVWLYGGQVVEFAYRFFWGYVRPSGSFTAAQTFMISLAGTLGSLFFGLITWLIFRQNSSSSLRYFGLRTFRYQIYFSLIYYPAFTAILQVGDWRTIYDFSATPILSWTTAVFHVLFLILHWYGDREGWYDQPAFQDAATQEKFRQLQKNLRQTPQDENLYFAVIQQLRQGGAKNLAKRQLKTFLNQHPYNGEAHFELGLLKLATNNTIPNSAVESINKALENGLKDKTKLIIAYQILGRYHRERDEGEKAVQYITKAIETAMGNQPITTHPNSLQKQIAHLHSQRALSLRRINQFDKAQHDVQEALSIAQRLNDETAVRQYQEELSMIEKQTPGSY